MRALIPVLLGFALLSAACSAANTSGMNNPFSPTSPTTSATTNAFTGTFVGSATDSTGSLMGSGLGSTSTTMTLVLSQNGNNVTGNLSFAGLTPTPGQATPTFAGTASGNTLSFNIGMPTGMMPTPNSTCSANANGTMTLSGNGQTLTGTFTGSNSCTGNFTNGQITLTRQ